MVYKAKSGEDARRYLGRRIFAPPMFVPKEWNPAGGSGKLIFQDGDFQWTITLDSRYQIPDTPKVFLDINLHVLRPGSPREKEMEERLRMLWDQAHTLIENIDANVNN